MSPAAAWTAWCDAREPCTSTTVSSCRRKCARPRSARWSGSWAHIEDVVAASAGTPDQITERFAAMLGQVDRLRRAQLPTGDMTFAEAKRTVEIFVSDVKPLLEQDSPPSRSSRSRHCGPT